MTKRIAVVNDLSGFGRCSLTAAISVIAAMGVQPCPLPTAILSAQTGYPSYFYDDYTDKMAEIISALKKLDLAVTLSSGEKSTEEYRALKEAGADR